MSKLISYWNRPKFKGIKFTEKSCTFQEYKDESDINNIVDANLHYKDPAFVTKLMLSGKLSDKEPVYGDFTQVKDYLSAINTVKEAQEQFALLPAKIRDRFDNKPENLLAFVNDKANYSEGVALGIFEQKDVVQKVDKVDIKINNEEVAGVKDTVTVTPSVTSAQ